MTTTDHAPGPLAGPPLLRSNLDWTFWGWGRMVDFARRGVASGNTYEELRERVTAMSREALAALDTLETGDTDPILQSRLAASLRRVLDSLDVLIEDHADPGSEALSAQWEATHLLSRLPAGLDPGGRAAVAAPGPVEQILDLCDQAEAAERRDGVDVDPCYIEVADVRAILGARP